MDKAMEYYRAAINANPNYFEAHNNLAVAYLNLKQFAVAKIYSEKALSLNPQSADLMFNLARVEYHLGNYQKAIEWFEAGINVSHNRNQQLTGHIGAVIAHTQNKTYRSAFEHSLQVIELNPNDSEAYIQAAKLSLILGKAGEADYYRKQAEAISKGK